MMKREAGFHIITARDGRFVKVGVGSKDARASRKRAGGAEGAVFGVSTLDLANLPRTPDGKVDFADFLAARRS